MGPPRIWMFLLGAFVIASANEISEDAWNVRAIIIDNAEEVELQRQFDSDWTDLGDPLDWLDNVIETNTTNAVNEEDTGQYNAETDEEDETEDDQEEKSESSFSTSEEYESDEESDDINAFQDSSEETSEDSVTEDSDGIKHHDGARFADARRRGHHKRRYNRKRTFGKPWKKRRDETPRLRRRFRNPHGSKVQIPHPPPTGRWQKVWQKFNQSKPAQEGRWAAMYNRTRGYFNKHRGNSRRFVATESTEEQSESEDAPPQEEIIPHIRYLHNLTSHNQSHRWHLRNHTRHNITHHWPTTMENYTHTNFSLLWPPRMSNRTNITHWYHHKRGGSHERGYRRIGPHHREHRYGRPTPGRRWLEDKVTRVCNYLSSPRHIRYMEFIRNRETERRDYRIDFVEQMTFCCQQDYEGKLECFGNLTRARIDEFCRSDSSIPFRPWKPGQNPRAVRKIKPKCCLAEGEERYNCFNKTHQILERQGYDLIEDTESDEQVEVRQAPVNKITDSRRRFHRRERKRQHKWTPKVGIKTKCCDLGKTHGAKIEDTDTAVTVCNKLARKLSHKFKNRLICHMALGRCCINEARKQPQKRTSTTTDPELERELDAIDEMSEMRNVEEQRTV